MYSEKISRPGTIKTIFGKCLAAIEELGFFLREKDLEKGQITASSGTSIWSWGERIDIQLKESSENTVEIWIESISKSQLVSWGKNKVNVEKIIQYLKND